MLKKRADFNNARPTLNKAEIAKRTKEHCKYKFFSVSDIFNFVPRAQTTGLQCAQFSGAPYKSVKNGYAVGYTIADDKFLIVVSGYRNEDTDCHRFVSALKTALDYLKNLLPYLPSSSRL